MDETQLRLDGNAAAGMLREVFVYDLSAARGACASCGAIAQMGSQHLYMYPLSPGAVLRCQFCENVLMVFVHAGGRYRLGMQGLTWVEIRDIVEAADDV
jgi:ribosomal protein S27E